MLRLYGRSQGALEAAPFFVGCEQGPLRRGRRASRPWTTPGSARAIGAIGLLARRARRCRDGVAALLSRPGASGARAQDSAVSARMGHLCVGVQACRGFGARQALSPDDGPAAPAARRLGFRLCVLLVCGGPRRGRRSRRAPVALAAGAATLLVCINSPAPHLSVISAAGFQAVWTAPGVWRST